MSYDLQFVRRKPGQSWDEALDVADRQGPGGPDPKVWQHLISRVRDFVPDILIDEQANELTENKTGIQISCFAESAAISIPYWYTGTDAASVMQRVNTIARIVEEVTGLQAYDPQTSTPLAGSDDNSEAVATFDRVAGRYTDDAP